MRRRIVRPIQRGLDGVHRRLLLKSSVVYAETATVDLGIRELAGRNASIVDEVLRSELWHGDGAGDAR